MTVINERTY